MLKCLDKELIQSMISKYGMEIKKLNLSNNGRCILCIYDGILLTHIDMMLSYVDIICFVSMIAMILFMK